MEEQSSIERIQKFIEKVLQKANIGNFCVKIVPFEKKREHSVVFNIEVVTDSNILIGQNGENLRAWQYLIRLLVRRHLAEDANIPFLIDINGYRQQKDEFVFEAAIQAAQEAKRDRKAVIMRPMSAYERRLVHVQLSDDKEVHTESIGEGSIRKVVVRPASSKEIE